MNQNELKNIAGLSLGGGRKENFFFCMLQYFEESDRWFLSSVHQLKDESEHRDNVITSWVENYNLKQMIIDFPLTNPVCESCTLECPGTSRCHNPVIVDVRSEISNLIRLDTEMEKDNPKLYEQARNEDDLFDFSKDIMEKDSHIPLLSKPFKRKLKKGYIPYWNRPVDFWIWKYYYDQLLSMFKISYDSFGDVSMMLMSRWKYLKKHLPKSLDLYESNSYLCLLELMRGKIISKKDLLELQDINVAPLARINIIRSIEEKLDIFIYDKDLELIVKNPKAFDSFLLSVAGQQLMLSKTREVTTFGEEDPRFVVPSFVSSDTLSLPPHKNKELSSE